MTCARSCAVLLLLVLLAGCGSGPSYLRLKSGNWVFVATSRVFSDTTVYVVGNVTQAGTEVRGAMHVDDASGCFDLSTDVPLTGVVQDQNITLTSSTISDQVITVSVSGTSESLTGTYTITGGCAGGDQGTVTGTYIPPISGTWNGSFTTPSGGTFSATANVRQGLADAGGLFDLTGTVAFTNSSCMTSATLSSNSFIVGDIVYMELTTNSGLTDFFGYITDPANPRSMEGTYQISSGTCAGDSGSGTFTKR